MTEIIFEVTEDEVDGGYSASALGYGIHTRAPREEIRGNVKEAVDCYFDGDMRPETDPVALIPVFPMDSVFVYWDNSNIFHEAQRLAVERNEGPNARYRVRSTSRTCCAWRMPTALAQRLGRRFGPPGHLWNRLDGLGVDVALFDRGEPGRGEQNMPDRVLQLRMLEDALDYNGRGLRLS